MTEEQQQIQALQAEVETLTAEKLNLIEGLNRYKSRAEAAEAERDTLRARVETLAQERTFPIQSERGHAPHPTRIPWSVAEKAYSVYRARFGSRQSLERLAERGGFGPSEMDDMHPTWMAETSQIDQLKAELSTLRAERDAAVKQAKDLVALEAAYREQETITRRRLANVLIGNDATWGVITEVAELIQAERDAAQVAWQVVEAVLSEMARSLGPSWPPNFSSDERVYQWGKRLQKALDAARTKSQNEQAWEDLAADGGLPESQVPAPPTPRRTE